MSDYSESAQIARVRAGFKGGTRNRNPIKPPKLTFGEGWPQESISKMTAHRAVEVKTPVDMWFSRRNK